MWRFSYFNIFFFSEQFSFLSGEKLVLSNKAWSAARDDSGLITDDD